ncbi:MAG: 1-deoxy-D-xylulose-5-phosphate synthase [Spirochaetia bacterium]|nr:1-deoxy-D-xylulose-5-phosphate synthase [Spirochaetia bacterium]
MALLEKINSPADLKKLKVSELPHLCIEIRNMLIDSVSQSGGHLSSNLGSVELTVAIHYVFESPHDKICWDVGHQTYSHKILTGRKNELSSIRKYTGISGFPKQEESIHDSYSTGHAGTSISQALAEKNAMTHNNIKRQALAVIGDASIASGVAFEALNHAGHMKIPLIVLLNDNEMSISKNVGALSYSLTSAINTRLFRKWRRRFLKFLHWLPIIGPISERLLLRFESSMKSILTDHQFFEELGFQYLGPLEGHNVIKLVKFLKKIKYPKEPEEPVIVHIVTKKGKGYKPAEINPTLYHGVKPFNKETGISESNNTSSWPLSNFAAETLVKLAEKDKNICAITPAMREGSGLVNFSKKFPDRFFDVGIAEQHAATFAGALAKAGFKPFLFLYSTFLQRCYDQIIEDIALMNLPVKIVIDRAGFVGGDGETHQGMYDFTILSCVPNMKILSASSTLELMQMISYIKDYNEGPICVRFPKKDYSNETFIEHEKMIWPKNYNPFSANIAAKGKDILIIAEGAMIENALAARELLLTHNISSEVLSLRSIQPFDLKTITRALNGKKAVFSIENHCIELGIANSLLFQLKEKIQNIPFIAFGYPKKFIEHGDSSSVEKKYGLDADGLKKNILNHLKKLKKI